MKCLPQALLSPVVNPGRDGEGAAARQCLAVSHEAISVARTARRPQTPSEPNTVPTHTLHNMYFH